MKITDTENIKNIFLKKNQKTEKSSDKAFDEILDKKIENSTISKPYTEPSSTVQSVSDVFVKPPADREEIVSRISMSCLRSGS